MNKKKVLVTVASLVLVLSVYFAIKDKANKMAEEKLQEAGEAIDFYADFSYKKVRVNLFGLNVHIHNVILSPHESKENIFIDEIVIYDMDDRNELPHFAHIKLNGFYSEAPRMRENFIMRHGFAKNTKVDIELDYVYKKHDKAFFCRRLNYGSDGIGTLNIQYHISNIDLDLEDVPFLDSSFPNVLLHSAEIRFENVSFFERFIRSIAEEEGKEFDEVMQELGEMIDNERIRTKDDFYQQILQVLKEFIRNPEKIGIEFAPEAPISLDRLLEIKSLGEAVRLLNAKVNT